MGKKTTEQFIKESKEVHGDFYDYSKVKYITGLTNVIIICPIHGDFEQTPKSHKKGGGCLKCNRNKRMSSKKEQFIQRSNEIHNNFYNYDKVNFTKADVKVTITCPIHGDFEQTPNSHSQGHGCYKCYADRYKIKSSDFIQKAKEVHGDFYNYSKVKYTNAHDKVTIRCPIHGDFEQAPRKHLEGRGCSKCFLDKKRTTVEQFIQKANEVHNNFYDYSKVSYNEAHSGITITCPIHGDFEQTPANHLQGSGCLYCSHSGPSTHEIEVNDFIHSLGFNTIQSDRSVIKPYELDIVIPSKGIAIEYNGLYWHSERYGRDKNYHLDKTNKANEQGYQLIHIFQDEWIDNKQLVKEKLTHLLGVNSLTLYARNTTIGYPSKQEKKDFYNLNHIQGSIGTGIDIGLYYGFDLVACLSFTEKGDGIYDLIRFATAINVVGGFTKLISYFKKNYNWNTIYTFADKRYSNGNLYLTNGFEWLYDTKPNYWYVIGNGYIRENRIKYQKHKLHKVLESFDPDFTEVENCNNNGLYRIFDCGHMKFEMRNE